MTIYTVAIVVVFGGIESINNYTNEAAANAAILEWANDNNPEGLVFDDAIDALEWFSRNSEDIDYSIQLFESEIAFSEER